MIRHTIAPIRAARLALHLVYALMLALLYPSLGRSMQRRILQRWSRELLQILGIHFKIQQQSTRDGRAHGLIVANHISWLDIFVLNAATPLRFVAKSEVRGWPVIGWLCERAGTLFIERGKARAAARMNLYMTELLEQGECLAVFPEGTTTDGGCVAHFHSSLLQPAIDADVILHPVALRYQGKNGMRSTTPAYIGDLSFGTSLWRILRNNGLEAQLAFPPPLHAASLERRALAQTAQREIESVLLNMECVRRHAAVIDLSYPLNTCATSSA